jgi:hypothetical protein
MPTAIGQGSMRVIAAGVAVAAYSVFFSTPPAINADLLAFLKAGAKATAA